MRTALPATLAVCITLSAAAAPLLDRLSVHATGTVTITVPVDRAPANPLFQAADGSWQPLDVHAEGNRATFTVPAEAQGRTVVILHVPEWLNLDDTEPPVVEQVTVDGVPLEVAAEIDLGHRTTPPGAVRVLFRDEGSPLDALAALVTINGAPFPGEAVIVLPTRNGDEGRYIDVSTGHLEPGEHTLGLRVPDAAPVPNYAQVTIRLVTGPLVKNGGFEEVSAAGAPLHWVIGMWSRDDKTAAELRVVEGGRTGERALELLGIDGSLNLVCGQQVPLSRERTYAARGFYQATSGRGYLSMIADDKEQYLNSPPLPAAEDWTPFEWQFTTGPHEVFHIYLRNGGKGFVRYDDVTIEEVVEEE